MSGTPETDDQAQRFLRSQLVFHRNTGMEEEAFILIARSLCSFALALS